MLEAYWSLLLVAARWKLIDAGSLLKVDAYLRWKLIDTGYLAMLETYSCLPHIYAGSTLTQEVYWDSRQSPINFGVIATLSGNRVEPEATAREKYSAAGGFDMGSFEAFGFSPAIVETLRVAANHSVSANTWASYATAERHIARAENVTGVNITFPFSLKSLLA